MNKQTKQMEYKGYSVIGIENKKIVAQITDNKHYSTSTEFFGKKINIFYEPPIKFIFKNYDTMVKFIDENPK